MKGKRYPNQIQKYP